MTANRCHVVSIFAIARIEGVLIIRRGDDLAVFPASAASKDLIEVVREHKPALLQALKYEAKENPPRQRVIDLYLAVRAVDIDRAEELVDNWKERIAICETDGMTADEAEVIAWQDMKADAGRSHCWSG